MSQVCPMYHRFGHSNMEMLCLEHNFDILAKLKSYYLQLLMKTTNNNYEGELTRKRFDTDT